jgi:hypothetical protein
VAFGSWVVHWRELDSCLDCATGLNRTRQVASSRVSARERSREDFARKQSCPEHFAVRQRSVGGHMKLPMGGQLGARRGDHVVAQSGILRNVGVSCRLATPLG